MLESLIIHNLALIEDLHIDFREGFNVLSGETGAGKSIILGALELLLGERVESSAIRSGTEEASVAALFSINRESWLNGWLQEHGIELDDGALLLRRVLKKGGRSFIYVQSQLMTKADLNTISTALFDIHGQHQHQSLLYNGPQRRVLDSYGALTDQLDEFALLYRQVEELKKESEALEEALAQIKREVDYLQFVADELVKAELKAEEDDLLEQEIRLLSQWETISDNLDLAYGSLKGEGALAYITQALQACQKASKGDSSLNEYCERLESLYVETQDLAETFRARLSSITFSQERLDTLQSRQAQLQRYKKKYGPTLERVIAYRDEVLMKLSKSETDDEELHLLNRKIEEQSRALSQKAQELRKVRQSAALELQQAISGRLVHLGMPHVDFSVSCQEKAMSVNGIDHIEFLFSANLGEPQKKLKEIISGGELSRVMLAIKTVLAENDEIETLIFDEVDAGIGGAVAIAVAQQMEELAQSRQIIVITHNASIAAKANEHFVVAKAVSGGRTFTQLALVTGEQRVKEVARMLSGDEEDPTALTHARSLLEGGKI